MGLNLAQAAMLEDRYVTYLPAYGAEVRGGTANCTVSISDEEIASPVAYAPAFIIALNQPSMVRFQNKIQSGGVMFLGLIAPHIARRLVGPNHTVVIPASALVGATLLLLADVAGNTFFPVEMPAGVMVSAFGAPYFLYVLAKS